MRLTTTRYRGLGGRLTALALAGVLLTLPGCGGGDSGGGGEAGGPVTLRFSWWGNEDRAKLTQKAIDAFQAANPGITVKPEYSDFNGYFDKLATGVAANDAPDVITLGGAYPREYGDRGALLDLAEVSGELKTDKIDKAALSNGNFEGKQYGVPTGVNAFGVVVNPKVFQAAGVPLPDDNTWTWDDYQRIAQQVGKAAPKGTYGSEDPTSSDALDLFARQRGESLYTEDGKIGLTEQTLTDWFTMTTAMRDSGAAPPAAMTSELAGQPSPEQTLMGRGLAGMQLDWTNQLGSLRSASGSELRLLRAPGESAATKPGMWLQASQIYTISARTKHPKEAAKFLDFLVNSPEAGKITLANRGIPANSDVLAAVKSSLPKDEAASGDFIAAVTPKVGPALVIGPTGSTESVKILERVNAEVLFNRLSPADGAKRFLKGLNSAIK
ncbi:carbohydrate ABC transporter substrate-binding protein (CUT1 family) [Kribbella amoyensis]|uniref:Carbohydrate ABC transporter substrate-binding protein (CUT1 family) n=1 Tax=Kribbella amoyensis TaxID=996641 RepID=A0A561BUL8_9ACTN|nr:sugar ABC transporter substrate-binding protein [Kribbella amoyensis]TWD82595.1 carbohydrate ABC transporter substrate-binding protein (CUT1 family) [Kribbella amoyensis]